MSFAPIEAVKAHPMLAVGAGVIAIGLIVLMSSTSTQTVNAAPQASSDAVDSGNSLQAMLAGIQGQISIAQLQADAADKSNEAALEAKRIDSQTTNFANTLQAQISELGLSLSAQTTQQANTLQANVLNTQTAAQTEQQRIAANTTIQTQQTIADALVRQGQQTVDIARIGADTSRSQFDAMVQIAGVQGQTNVGVAQAARPCSSYLFGLISDC